MVDIANAGSIALFLAVCASGGSVLAGLAFRSGYKREKKQAEFAKQHAISIEIDGKRIALDEINPDVAWDLVDQLRILETKGAAL